MQKDIKYTMRNKYCYNQFHIHFFKVSFIFKPLCQSVRHNDCRLSLTSTQYTLHKRGGIFLGVAHPESFEPDTLKGSYADFKKMLNSLFG